MNTNLNSRVAKALVAAIVAVVVFISSPMTSLANGGKHNKVALNDEQVSVNYIGNDDQNVIFRVEFKNPTAEKFWLIIKNDAGDVVYRKQFSDVNFAKSVYFQKDESTDMHPTFIIRNAANEVVRQFAVNTTLTESTVVTKL